MKYELEGFMIIYTDIQCHYEAYCSDICFF